MVDVQDTKDKDSTTSENSSTQGEEKEESSCETEEDFADTYIRRRGIDTSSPTKSRIKSIGYLDGEVVAEVETLNIDFFVRLGKPDESPNTNLVNFLSNCPANIIRENGEINDSEYFNLWFSADLRRVGFTDNSKKYRIETKENISSYERTEDIIDKVYQYYLYRRESRSGSTDMSGIKREIKQVEGVSENEFKIRTDIGDESINWIFNVPMQVDISNHPVARLIENEGSGDPRNLSYNTNVYVVHKDDLIGHIKPVGFDTDNEWALVMQDQFDSWNPDMYQANSVKNDTKSLKKFALLYLTYILILIAVAVSLPEIYNALL